MRVMYNMGIILIALVLILLYCLLGNKRESFGYDYQYGPNLNVFRNMFYKPDVQKIYQMKLDEQTANHISGYSKYGSADEPGFSKDTPHVNVIHLKPNNTTRQDAMDNIDNNAGTTTPDYYPTPLYDDNMPKWGNELQPIKTKRFNGQLAPSNIRDPNNIMCGVFGNTCSSNYDCCPGNICLGKRCQEV